MATVTKKLASVSSEKIGLQREVAPGEWTTVMYCKSEVYSESECPEYRIAKE